MQEPTVKDYSVGDRVLHVFHAKMFTVVKVGRKYVHCDYFGKVYRFNPTSLVKSVNS
jgi:hypothetical protein